MYQKQPINNDTGQQLQQRFIEICGDESLPMFSAEDFVAAILTLFTSQYRKEVARNGLAKANEWSEL